MDSINPDLDGTLCSVGGCFKQSDGIGVLHVTIPSIYGFTINGQGEADVEVPLCGDDLHRFRGGFEEISWESFPGS